jgi:hypothetical protein
MYDVNRGEYHVGVDGVVFADMGGRRKVFMAWRSICGRRSGKMVRSILNDRWWCFLG